MRQVVRFASAAALGMAVVALAGSSELLAKGHKNKMHRCTFAAHGSDAEKDNGKGAGGSAGGGAGGGKPTKGCSKTFGKWSDGSVTVYVSNANAPSGFSTALSDLTSDCFTEWACHSGLTFSLVGNAADADITVTWSDLGTTGILGQTSTWASGGLISASSVTMNSNQSSFSWTRGPALSKTNGCENEVGNGNTSSANYDIFSVLLHEIGHSLGVDHPTARCSTRDACYHETMNPCTDAEEYERRALNSGDIQAIQSNYGQ